MKKKSKPTPEPVEGFVIRAFRRTYEGSKHTVIEHGLTGIIALLVSSVVPMLQSWHADKQHQAEVSSIRLQASSDTQDVERRCVQLIKDLDDRTDRHIIEVENNENAKFNSVWQYIRAERDSKETNKK